jgi:Cysteine-rich secretory protein family
VKLSFAVLLLCLSTIAYAQVDDAAARQLFDRINQARSQAGVGELRWDDQLSAAAIAHAQLMAQKQQLSHQFSGEAPVRQRIIASGLRSDASGENVAFGPDVDNLFNGWMKSPPHRANILDPRYNSSAIALVRRGDSLWAVQDFARKVVSYSDKEVETIVGTQLTRARAQAGLGDLTQANAPGVHAAACDMAQRGQMEAPTLVRRLSDVQSVFTFTASEPQKLPQALARTAPTAHSFAVGSCFGKTAKFPEGTNWVVVAFY